MFEKEYFFYKKRSQLIKLKQMKKEVISIDLRKVYFYMPKNIRKKLQFLHKQELQMKLKKNLHYTGCQKDQTPSQQLIDPFGTWMS